MMFSARADVATAAHPFCIACHPHIKRKLPLCAAEAVEREACPQRVGRININIDYKVKATLLAAVAMWF